MSFFRETELNSRQMMDGISLKAVWGDKTMITIFDLEPGSVIPVHSHENEQISYVISGEMEFRLGNEKKILKAGDGVIVRANVEHSARALEKKTKALDAWYPIREDYR